MTQLLEYQLDGVKMLHGFSGRALLADSMGLGKSLTALTYMVEAGAYPVVIVCPKSAKLHWQREAMQHLGLSSVVLSGMTPTRAKSLRHEKILIVNYDVLGGWLNSLRSFRPQLVIGDECHYCQSLRAQRTKFFRRLTKGVPRVVLLSGTPLTNRPFELFPPLNILRPDLFPNPFTFGFRYCDAERSFGRWKFNGAKRLAELHRLLRKTVMIRRTKAEVLSQLPPKRRSVVPLEITNRREYDRAEADLIRWLAETDLEASRKAARAERYTRFTHLKKLAARLKLPAVFDWLDDWLDASEGKIIVGAIHRSVVTAIHDRYRDRAVMIHGGTSTADRQRAEDLFRRTDRVRMLVGNIKAAGVCLNLPEANAVAFAELPWTPGDCQQFEDRACRLTTKHAVDVSYLIAHGTIEEVLCRIIDRKQGVLDRVLDGVTSQDSSLTIFDDLQGAMFRKGGRR